VETAYTDEGTAERPVAEERRRAAVLRDAEATELARLGQQVEDHFGVPQDIEWARTADGFVLLQARPITALPPVEADPPTDWTVPEPTAMYVRASIVEQLPNPLSPLFEDLVGTSVTRSLQALFREMLGEDVIRQSDVDLPTVNGYAYYRYSRTGMLRLMLHSRKAFTFILTPDGAQNRWRNYSLPRYRATLERWTDRPLSEISGPELLRGVAELLDAGTEYYTAVQTIIPIAATAEVIFSQLYDKLVRRAGDPPASTFLIGFDSLPIAAEKSLFDLATWTRSQPALVDALVAGEDPDPHAPEWEEWLDRLQDHLDRYGHTVYNLDFINAVPADDPAPLIDTIRFYLRNPDRDPYARQRTTAQRREQATTEVLGRLYPVRKKPVLRALRWAQRVAPVREDALANIGLAWPQMRWMLAELGDRLTDAGLVEQPDDVYWLRRDELAAALAATEDGTDGPSGLTEVIEQRRQEWRGRRRVTPPQLLPERNWGRVFDSMMPATTREQATDVLTGIGASAGRATATARVLSGPTDFGQLQAGDVLVASITTPAWTSLFARAAAVVTDIGGPLSHSSIVAREYGIPAVLGTGVATRRITSGQTITVDGDTGRVILTESVDEPEDASSKGGSRRIRGLVAAGAVTAGIVGLTRWRRRRRR
jgi:rifampicin phosphotransferase